LYFTGVIVLLAHLFLQHLRMRRFVGRAATVDDPEWQGLLASCARSTGVRRHVRLLRSPERTMPMTLGTRRASIVIPSIADTWDEDRRRAVLMHELAHVARYDCLTQALAIVTRAVYWCHPGAWWIVRRLRIERELACDDRVIAAGTEAKEYAGHLLEIAYSFRRHRAPVLAVSMARPSQLEGRMLAVLDAARNRSRPTRLVRLAGGAAAVMLVLGLAAARPTALAGGTPVTALPSTEPGVAPEPGPADVDAASARPKETAGVSARRVKEAAAPAAVAQDGVPGTWEIRPSETKGMVQLRLVELRSSSSTNVPIEQLQGLSSAQLTGAGGPVTFRVKRDAGTFTFEGVLRNGVGAGTFSFAPDANFPAELAKRGFARPSGPEQYQLARHDIGFAFLDELTRQGYAKPQTADLVRAGQHGVQTTYLREMGALGYRLGSLDPLITLRDHGVSPNYIRELADLGYKGLAADDLRQARDHGVSPEYVRGMRDAGYTSIPMPELVRLRDHGVSPEFVKELGDAGQRKVALDQLVRLRDHGVSPEYVREMTKLGYSLSLDQLVNARDHGVSLEYAREMKALGYSLPIDGLVQARDHGVSVEYVRAMAALGYTGLPMETLIRLRDHGVSAQYAEELKALGYDKVAFEDLITLRDHGLSVERIKAANARAGTRLPIDLLKSLASGGMR
jgi:hypothetical protein